MEDSKGIIRGECEKCSHYCLEYNANCIAGFPFPNAEECLKADKCAICECPASMHKAYTFKTIREKEAFENIRKIYNEYRLETCLEASVNDTQKLMLERQNFTYGEISLLSFHELLSVAKPKENEIFYDLGCGAAKPVIYASFLFPFKKCCGIELLPTVYELAAQYEKRYNLLIEGKQYKHTDYEIKPNIKIMKGDMLEIDFSDADIIYLPCTTFDVPTMKKISKCCAKLKPGTRIITLTKPLPCLTEKDCTVIFNVFDKREWLMTWGLEPVIYQMKE